MGKVSHDCHVLLMTVLGGSLQWFKELVESETVKT